MDAVDIVRRKIALQRQRKQYFAICKTGAITESDRDLMVSLVDRELASLAGQSALDFRPPTPSTSEVPVKGSKSS